MSITDAVDSFTENDMRLFESVKDMLMCDCGRPLWIVSTGGSNHPFKIKCLNCKKHLTLRQLYNVDLKPKIRGNTNLVPDGDLLNEIGFKIAEMQKLLGDIQISLVRRAEEL